MSNWKVILAIITCNVVLMSASYTMLIPFLPIYLLNELGASPDSINMWTGAIFAVSFAVCAIMAPIWGKLADKKGKKLMLIRSAGLIALTYLFGALVQTPFQLLLVRILQGFAAGLWPASLAIMSAFAPKNKVGICMGVMQSANICGGILGPLLGGLLANEFGIRISFFIASAAVAIITVVSIFFIKEPPRDVDNPQAAPSNKPVNVSYKSLLTREGVGLILVAAGLTNMVILLLQPIMTLYIGQLRGTTENLLSISGIVFSLSGISGAIAAPIWGRQGQAKGFYKTLVISLTAAGILISAQFLPNSLVPFAILQFCVGLGFSGIFPSANAMLINLTSPLERGSAFGMLFSAQQIGGAIGPLIGGLIATYVNLGVIFLLSGCILVLIAGIVFVKAPASLKASPNQAPETPSQAVLDDIKRQMAEEVAKEMAKEKQLYPENFREPVKVAAMANMADMADVSDVAKSEADGATGNAAAETAGTSEPVDIEQVVSAVTANNESQTQSVAVHLQANAQPQVMSETVASSSSELGETALSAKILNKTH